MIEIESMMKEHIIKISTNILTHLKADISTISVDGLIAVDVADMLIDSYIEEINKEIDK